MFAGGIIQTVEEGNLGSIFGWGFPAFKGGVYQFVNDYGIFDFMKKCEEYEQRLGPRFKVPRRLRKMAEAEFYEKTDVRKDAIQ